ncbi:SsgA family sporulation/cell division regulator [Streptomyces sp. NBC_01476]|uniref:SsgA family sporulation/cell division regulator n=1 Tax=Streptomyces sp. NBC_01476 TaxID=2903881 RepID=UPI002E2F34D2|nr:SsgA family sporulation/cell division regulator [Streptomyces sp. NBC_01476]
MEVRTTGCVDLPGDEAAVVTADLVYRPRDCLAVNMVLRGPDGVAVGWTFAWELLSQGLVGPAGEGDIRVRPLRGAEPLVEVVLATSFGARVRFPARDIGFFVSRVRAFASHDEPHIARSLDAELATIMEEA